MFKTQLSPLAQRRRMASRRGRRKAQTLVETALCLVFIVLPMFGAGLQFAIVINASHSLEEIAREGARFASVHGGETTIDSAVTQSSPASLRYYIKQVCGNTSINYNDIKSITITPAAASRVSGQPITVTIVYPMAKKLILDPTRWSNMRYGTSRENYSYGTYLSRFAQDFTVASTFVLE